MRPKTGKSEQQHDQLLANREYKNNSKLKIQEHEILDTSDQNGLNPDFII